MRVHPGPIRVPPPNRPLTLDHCTESGGSPTAWPGQSTRVIIRPALPQLCICRPSKAYWALVEVLDGIVLNPVVFVGFVCPALPCFKMAALGGAATG